MKLKIKNSKFKISRPKVAVAMSGGLDSSTAAKLLQKKGYECLGIFMRLGIEKGCCDEAAARRVCQKLGMKFYPLDLARQFKKEVKDYFLKSYAKGLTPNPCVNCNKFLKFGALLEKAKALGCDHLATGHYVKLKKTGKTFKVHRARDAKKDQTYFLYNLTPDQLKHVLFPMGDLIKEKARAAADKEKLPYLKDESQDICFLAAKDGRGSDHNDFLRANLKLKPGPIKDQAGEIVGQHSGLPLYTVGQRKGVEIGGVGPFYVVRADYKNNTLHVTNNPDDPALRGKELVIEEINWLSGREPKFPFKCQAVIRYRHPAQACVLKKGKNGYEVVFSEPQRAITPGQSAVFYRGDELLGGGVIS